VLYACLTGRPPVVAESLVAHLQTLRFRQIQTPRALRPEVPVWLSGLCMQCLAADPAQRPPSAGDLARRLLVGEESGLGPVAVEPSDRGLQVVLAVVLPLTLLAGVGALWAALRGAPELAQGGVSPVASADVPGVDSDLVEGARAQGTDAARLEREGWAALAGGRFAEALAHAEALCALRPTDPRAHALRARALTRLMRYAEAEPVIERMLELAPSSAEGYLLRGRLSAALRRDPQLTLRDLSRALELDPQLHDAHLARGCMLAFLGRHADALPDLRLAAENPVDTENPADVWNYYGFSLNAVERWSDALGAFDRALELDPTHHRARGNRALARFSLERYAEALEDLEFALGQGADSIPVLHLHGRTLGKLGRWSEALQVFTHVLKRDPDAFAARVSRAEAYFALRLPEPAEADLAIVVRRFPRRADTLLQLARVQLAQDGKRGQALQNLNRVLELAPAHADALEARARLCLEVGRLEEALADCGRVLALRPTESTLFGLRARVLHSLGRPAESLADLERALGGDAEAADAVRMTFATLYYELGRYDEALPLCRAALAAAPDDANANVMLARLHLARGELDAARAQLGAMQERFPESPLTWSLVFEVEPPAKAREVLEALERERERPSGWLLELVGRCDVLLGDYAQAERRFTAAAAFVKERPVAVRLSLWVAVTHALRDELPAARAAAARALEQAGDSVVRWEAAIWLALFGDTTGLQRLEGRHPFAAINAIAGGFLSDEPPDPEACLATCTTPGQRAQMQSYLGILAERRGDLDAARSHYDRALRHVAHGSRVLVWAKLRLAALDE